MPVGLLTRPVSKRAYGLRDTHTTSLSSTVGSSDLVTFHTGELPHHAPKCQQTASPTVDSHFVARVHTNPFSERVNARYLGQTRLQPFQKLRPAEQRNGGRKRCSCPINHFPGIARVELLRGQRMLIELRSRNFALELVGLRRALGRRRRAGHFAQIVLVAFCRRRRGMLGRTRQQLRTTCRARTVLFRGAYEQ